ncbi:MAG: pre-rRNA-processing protein pno1 [Chrysothrix sp. TS-e1954]|nr:MAG: pre-rRNA-processing protein pno1 [Chrysothrix sp. TS-e1954]
MPAPTALLRAPEQLADETAKTRDIAAQVDDITLHDTAPHNDSAVAQTNGDQDAMLVDAEDRPVFAPEVTRKSAFRIEQRSVAVPPHRMSPLKASWPKMYPPLVEHLKLQVRMNLKKKAVELRTSKLTKEGGSALQQGQDFVQAFCLGFDVDDAIALLRLDDLYIETFEIKDVRRLQHEHVSRAIGRIAGKDGKTRFAIENASKTRIVLADQKIHILGGFKNIGIAREAVVSLILGSPPSKVYGNLRTVASRMKERW